MTNSDQPPAYSSLHTSTENITAAELTVPIYDDEADLLVNDSFQDKNTRLGFTQKVLTIKLLQLLGVLAIILIFAAVNPGIRYFMYRDCNYVHLFVLSTLAYIATIGLLLYCDEARRTNPYRYIFLVAYPLSFTLLISFSTTWWNILELVLAAWVYYCVAVFALLVYSIFAYQTKLEFVTRNGILVGTLVLILMYALTIPFMYHADAFYILYFTIVVFVQIIFLLYNMEMMMSKSYRIVITPSDFVDGALNLHIDCYYTFIKVVVPKVKRTFGKLTAYLNKNLN